MKAGYKQTEVGIIPSDWNTKPCSAISDLITVGIVIRPTQYYVEQGIPALRSANVREDGINDFDMVFISEKANKLLSKSQLRTNDVVSVRTGYPGTSAGVPSSLAGANCIDLLITRPSKLVNSKYLVYWINSSHGKDQVLRNQGGLAQQHFNVSELRNLVVALPPTLAEQEAIAEALSDADAFIEAVEQLLTKKRQVKQGAMQELLTGKRRLPGFEKKAGYKQTPSGIFPEDWDIVPLNMISSMHGRIGWQGLKQSEFTMKADDPFLITGMNFKDGEIRWEEVYHVPWERYEIAKEIQLKSGDVLMTKDGTIGKMLYVDEIPYPGKATLNSHLLVFRPLNNKYIPKFLFYQMNSKAFFNHIEQEKSGTTFFGITQEAVGKYNVFLPSIPEQTAITEILSDMDVEIAALEEKLSKARQVKQGMMSMLLTGRVRLVEV